MKKYIQPNIKVKKLFAKSSFLAASGEVEANDITFSSTPVDPANALSKGNYSPWDSDEEDD